MNIIGPHDHRAIAHPKSALSWGNASRDARQARPGSNPKIVPGSHGGFNSVKAAATRDKKLPLSLVRCQLHISRMLHRQIKDTPCRFRCPHCSTRHKILVSAAAIVHEQIAGAPGADWNLGSRRFAQPPELKPFNIDCFFDRIT